MATLAIWRTLADKDAQDLLWGLCRPNRDVAKWKRKCRLNAKTGYPNFKNSHADNSVILFDHEMTVAAASEWVIDVDPVPGTTTGESSQAGRRRRSPLPPRVAPHPIFRALGELAGPAV